MSFDVAPMIGIFIYFILGDILISMVDKKKLPPNRAFWLGFWVPILFCFLIVFFGFLYRYFNEIHYDQGYVDLILYCAPLVLGYIKGSDLRNRAIENSGPNITPSERAKRIRNARKKI